VVDYSIWLYSVSQPVVLCIQLMAYMVSSEVSVGFSTIGAALHQYPNVNLPAVYSNFMVSITSICVSHIMLRIRSLAAELASDSALVFNNAEVSRLRWKKGPNDGVEAIEETTEETTEVLDINLAIKYMLEEESRNDQDSVAGTWPPF